MLAIVFASTFIIYIYRLVILFNGKLIFKFAQHKTITNKLGKLEAIPSPIKHDVNGFNYNAFNPNRKF